MRLLPEVVLLASLLAVVLAAVSPAELAVRALALANSSAVLEEQAEIPSGPRPHTSCTWLKHFVHFHRIGPLGRFDLVVAMFVCVSVCVFACPLFM